MGMNTIQKSQQLFPHLFRPAKALAKAPPLRKQLVFGIPRKPGDGWIFLVAFMMYLVSIFPSMVYALPSGGTVEAGGATINQPSQDKLVIQQTTDKAIIDWRGFGIQAGEQVDFQLPSASGVTLNRVTGGERSDIFGKLTSNGNLMLINPNGILFGAGAQIDVHGLVASTSDIANEDFLASRYQFNIPSTLGGIVVNQGRITAAQGGLVALVAPGVQNSGVINARLGRVALASGETFTLDLYGDQLVNLGIGSKVTRQITGLDGEALTSLVSNSGGIYADGGTVRLDVNAARDVVDNVINMSGIVQARSVEEQNGTIILRGGDAGRVRVSGTLDASGIDAGETGGTIHVFGENIGLFQSALLDASGDSGGGTVLVGGDYQGKGIYPTAAETFVDSGVSIFADALSLGDGGRTIFWADRRMRFFGSVFARGGRKKGNGGFVEVSGKEELFFDGRVDTSAPNGLTGTLLLDPENIVIANGSGTASSSSGAVTFTTFENTLEALTGFTNIELVANNSITLNNLTDNLLNLNISGSLTMVAVNGAITFADTGDKIQSNRNIDLTAGGNLILGSLESKEGNITLKAGDLILSGTVKADTGTTTLLSQNGGTIGVGDGSGTFSVSAGELQNITAANLVIGDATNGNITVGGISAANSNNVAAVTLNATKSGSSVTFANNASTFNALTVNANNGIALNSSLTASGNANLNAGTGVTLAAGISVSSDGTLSLSAAGGINALGSVSLSSANGLTLNDSFASAGTTSFSAGTGSFSVASGKTVATGNNSLSVVAGDIALSGLLNSGTATTTILSSNGGTIGVGDGSGTFSVSGSELQNITAGNLVIGDGTNSTITVDNVTAANSNNAGTVTLNAAKSGSQVTFQNNASTFNALTVNAASGINVNAAVTTATGNLALSGGSGTIAGAGATTLNSAGNLTLSNSFTSVGNASLTAGSTLTLANGITVSSDGTLALSATGGINAQGGAAVSSANGLTLNDDFTSAGATSLNAGTGSFTVAGGKTVTTGNGSLSVSAGDMVLGGSLNSGTGTTTILSSNGGTIGLGDTAGTLTIGGSELQNITAGNLVIGNGTNGTITVDDITAANSNNIGTVTLNATASGSAVNFNNDSTFNGLTVNAGNGVTVSGDLTTAGTTAFNSDSDGDGTGDFSLAANKTLSTGNNNLSLTVGGVTLGSGSTLTSGTGSTAIEVSQSGNSIGLGDSVTCSGACDLSFTSSELDSIASGGFTIGGANNGGISVDTLTTARPLTLISSGVGNTVTFFNTSSFNDLTVTAGGSILDNGGTGILNVSGASIFTGNDGISLTNNANVFTGLLRLNSSGGNAALAANGALDLGDSSIGGIYSLTAANDITLTGGLFTSSASASAVTLTSTGGGIFDGDVAGTLDIDAAGGGLVVDSVSGFGTALNPIETRVASVDIDNVTSGDVNLFESDGLNIVKINQAGPGDVIVSYLGTLTGESNVTASTQAAKSFINRNAAAVVLPGFGKTISELSTDQTVSLTRSLESGYFFGNRAFGHDGKTVTRSLKGPASGPFVMDVFNEDFELIEMAKSKRGEYAGLQGFSSFWGPLGIGNAELAKRPAKKSVGEEARVKKNASQKRKKITRTKNRPKNLGDTAEVPKRSRKKPSDSWLSSFGLGNFFK